MSRALWLIGFRAAGKTTLGRLLAGELGWRFLDLDEELEKREGMSLLELVSRNGAAEFRRKETALLREVSALSALSVVIATGGGCVESDESRKILAANPWPKVWLDPPAELLWERLENSPDRRKIGHLTDFPTMLALLDARRPFYEKIASSRLESQDINDCIASLKIVVEKR